MQVMPNTNDFKCRNVYPCCLFEVPVDVSFRYNRQFYRRINEDEAVIYEYTDDFETDFVFIDASNRNDVVAISVSDAIECGLLPY